MTPVLSARNITKNYGATLALDAVHFDLAAGEVHALMGENGAGKSTLGRILAGSVAADAGEIHIDGHPVTLTQPSDAQRLGIGMIYQELDLFPHLTVGENLVIGNLHFPEGPWVSREAIETFSRPYLEQVGLEAAVTALVADLPIAQQQLLAIARALSMNCRILLMDEPTSALSGEAAERLFALIEQLKAQGVSIVYVSHKMDEIFRLCDRVTVLRDGRTIGTDHVAATDGATLIRMMVGRNLDFSSRPSRMPSQTTLLSVGHLTTRKLRDVSFEVRAGEVLGVAGLVGSGRSELGEALAGLDPILEGTVQIHGRLVLVPEDRKRQGLMPQMSVRENSTLSILSRLARVGFLSPSREEHLFSPMTQRLKLKCSSGSVPVGTLSGGNQQKALLARGIFADPDVLFLDDPARGIDVGAKQDIYGLVDELAASGKGILLASSELPELLRCADRILVLNSGRVAGIFDTSEATQEVIMAAATRAH